MDWNYPDISLEEMVNLIKGFVDILILASGYQSTGLVAHWNSDNVKKAFQWGSFFQNVLTDMCITNTYQGSLKELEAALCHMKSDPYFPQGLASISCDSLLHAKEFVFTHLFESLSLRNSHLQALLTAMVEMDVNKLPGGDHDHLNAYMSKLQLHSVPVTSDAQGFPMNNTTRTDRRKCCGDDLTELAIEACMKRQSTVSCILKVEEGIDMLSKATGCGSYTVSNSLLAEKQKHDSVPISDRNMELVVDHDKWNHWRSKSVSYFLCKKTVRMVAGANMIFSAPKTQWEQVLKRLYECTNNTSETIELMLLGCMADKWSSLIEFFMSFSCENVTILKMYQDLCNLLPRISEATHFKVEKSSAKELAVLKYMDNFLGNHIQLLWQLSPILVAMAIPFWSPVFRLYLSEIEIQLKGKSSTMRCCDSVEDTKKHEECQLAEKIWCLYIFHIRGSHVLYGKKVSTLLDQSTPLILT
ncbi:hypothetical protein LINGRAHAP2_LOCUS4070 [Linum grandiflorum]